MQIFQMDFSENVKLVFTPPYINFCCSELTETGKSSRGTVKLSVNKGYVFNCSM